MIPEKLKKEIGRLKEAAREKAAWSDRVERSKIGQGTFDRGYVGHMEYDECYCMHDSSDPDMAVIRPSFIYHWEDPEKKMEALLGRFISNHFLHSLAYLGLDRCSLR